MFLLPVSDKRKFPLLASKVDEEAEGRRDEGREEGETDSPQPQQPHFPSFLPFAFELLPKRTPKGYRVDGLTFVHPSFCPVTDRFDHGDDSLWKMACESNNGGSHRTCKGPTEKDGHSFYQLACDSKSSTEGALNTLKANVVGITIVQVDPKYCELRGGSRRGRGRGSP
ncbi:hypothetical protein IE53DRAFT_184860 [Violaceomyces palustris]|uniref:Uncharacterized protein n=1 Tax=Violaceomyces palustris TaxID=1673888 RepID=A0ACD0NSD1_9BASI|nr:hypothetical protein IE53DRAFT_184860 [Violaceomyces palustris]